MDIQRLILDAIVGVQKISGEPDTPVGLDTCPINELPGFDSQRGLETTIQIEADIGIEITDRNLFIAEKTYVLLTVREIVARVKFLLTERGMGND